jgi:hypothetical protein
VDWLWRKGEEGGGRGEKIKGYIFFPNKLIRTIFEIFLKIISSSTPCPCQGQGVSKIFLVFARSRGVFVSFFFSFCAWVS